MDISLVQSRASMGLLMREWAPHEIFMRPTWDSGGTINIVVYLLKTPMRLVRRSWDLHGPSSDSHDNRMRLSLGLHKIFICASMTPPWELHHRPSWDSYETSILPRYASMKCSWDFYEIFMKLSRDPRQPHDTFMRLFQININTIARISHNCQYGTTATTEDYAVYLFSKKYIELQTKHVFDVVIFPNKRKT